MKTLFPISLLLLFYSTIINARDLQFMESQFAQRCEKLSLEVGSHWKQMALNKGAYSRWSKVLKKYKADPLPISASNPLMAQEKAKKRNQKLVQTILKCEALRLITAEHRYKKENIKAGTLKASSGGLMTCKNQEQPELCLIQAAHGQSQQLVCESEGGETQDYSACRYLLQAIDGFFYAKQANIGLQGIRHGKEGNKLQKDLSILAQEKRFLPTEKALEAEKKILLHKALLAKERAFIDSSEVATLATLLANFPTSSKLIEKCQRSAKNFNQIMTMTTGPWVSQYEGKAITTQVDQKTLQSNPQSLCVSVVNKTQHYVLMNEEVIQKVKSIILKSGIDALKHAGINKLLHQQAEQVQETIDQIESFKSPQFPIPQEAKAFLPISCGDKECEPDLGIKGHSFQSAGVSTLNFPEGIEATETLNEKKNSLLKEGDISNASKDEDEFHILPGAGQIPKKPGLANSLDRPKRSPGKFVDKPQNNQVTASSSNSNGASSAIPSSGPIQQNVLGKQNAHSFSVGVKVPFKGEGSGLRMIGGNSLGRPTKERPLNPLSALIKPKERIPLGQIIIRQPASTLLDKGLFKRISHRYQMVIDDKRLDLY
jgi:hypothetical protein